MALTSALKPASAGPDIRLLARWARNARDALPPVKDGAAAVQSLLPVNVLRSDGRPSEPLARIEEASPQFGRTNERSRLLRHLISATGLGTIQGRVSHLQQRGQMGVTDRRQCCQADTDGDHRANGYFLPVVGD